MAVSPSRPPTEHPLTPGSVPNSKPEESGPWLEPGLKCPVCSRQVHHLIAGESCAECWHSTAERQLKAEAAARITGNLDRWVDQTMARNGWPDLERKATLDRIPVPLKRLIHGEATRAILDGTMPAQGFGIGGGTGIGKSMALAALSKAMLSAYALREAKERGHIRPSWPRYIQWPDAVAKLRGNGAFDWAEAWVKELVEVDLLILDDLGAERIKGSYSEDWAASNLDRIVNGRYSAQKPTLYTTNTDAAGLLTIYGSRLISRLLGLNPLVQADSMPDLRIAGPTHG